MSLSAQSDPPADSKQTPEHTRQSLTWLVGIACGMVILVAFLPFRYPLLPGLSDPRAAWSKLVEPTWINGIQHILVYLGLTLLYIGALRILTRNQPNGTTGTQSTIKLHRRQVAIIVISWLICSGFLLAVTPAGESHDIFDYLFRGRMMAEYQGNPLAEPPIEFEQAPYYAYTAWKKHVDAYGPVWELSSAAVASSVRVFAGWVGWRDNGLRTCPASPASCNLLAAYLTGYRLLAIILTGVSAWLIAALVKRRQPSLVPAALAAWLWCPMTLIAVGIGGHNDAGMIALLLLSLWLLQRKQLVLTVIVLILAAHVKLTALIWLPAALLWMVRSWGWRRTFFAFLAGIVAGLTLSWLLYLPFDGWGSLPRNLHERSLYLANSPWKIVNYLLGQCGVSKSALQQLTVNLPTWLFSISAILAPMWMLNFRPKSWRRMSDELYGEDTTLWAALVGVSLLFLLIGTYWFQHWYIQWIVWPAVLLPASRFTRHVLPWLIFGGLAANFMMDFYLAAVQPGPSLVNYGLAVAITWGPALAAGCALWIRPPKQRKG